MWFSLLSGFFFFKKHNLKIHCSPPTPALLPFSPLLTDLFYSISKKFHSISSVIPICSSIFCTLLHPQFGGDFLQFPWIITPKNRWIGTNHWIMNLKTYLGWLLCTLSDLSFLSGGFLQCLIQKNKLNIKGHPELIAGSKVLEDVGWGKKN